MMIVVDTRGEVNQKETKSTAHYHCRCARYARIRLEGLGSSFKQCVTYAMSVNRQGDKSAQQSIKIQKKHKNSTEKGAEGTMWSMAQMRMTVKLEKQRQLKH